MMNLKVFLAFLLGVSAFEAANACDPKRAPELTKIAIEKTFSGPDVEVNILVGSTESYLAHDNGVVRITAKGNCMPLVTKNAFTYLD